MYLNLQRIHDSVLILGSRSGEAEHLERLGLVCPCPEVLASSCATIESTVEAALSEGKLDRSDLARIRQCGEALFDEVFPFTFRQWLQEATVDDELVLQLAEELFGLPFELMHTGESYLAAHLPIRRALPDFARARNESRSDGPSVSRRTIERIGLVGDPAGDLGEAQREVTQLYSVLAATQGCAIELRVADVHADEAAGLLGRSEHAHIAAHFDNGELRCGDAQAFRAWDTLRSAPQSVFLNGCNSVLKGGSLAGDTRDLLRGSTRNIVGTSLPVPDTFARMLALAMYRHAGHDDRLPDHRSLHACRKSLEATQGESAWVWGGYLHISNGNAPYLRPHSPRGDDGVVEGRRPIEERAQQLYSDNNVSGSSVPAVPAGVGLMDAVPEITRIAEPERSIDESQREAAIVTSSPDGPPALIGRGRASTENIEALSQRLNRLWWVQIICLALSTFLLLWLVLR